MPCTPRVSFMAEIIAQTERLILRREIESDRGDWLAHMNTPEVTAHLGGPRTAEEIGEKFARMARGWDEHGFSFMMVALRDEGTFLGHVGLGHIDTACAPPELQGAIQIGWGLRADYWGRGYAQEAAQAALSLAFELHAMEIVFGQTSTSNVASWRLMERLGMQRRDDLDYVDPAYPPQDNPTIIYALDRESWRAGQARRAGRVSRASFAAAPSGD